MRLITGSREKAETFKTEGEFWAAICLRDPGTPKPRLLPDITRVGRHDLECSDWRFDHELIAVATAGIDPCPFTAEMAKGIWEFLTVMTPHIETLLITCEAGVSRSPGVAAAIARTHGDFVREMQFWERTVPNPLVYRVMLETRTQWS